MDQKKKGRARRVNIQEVERQHLVRTIIEVSEILSRVGWSIAIPQTDEIDHLVVGEEERLVEIMHDSKIGYKILKKDTH
jgi:hypothetical protein